MEHLDGVRIFSPRVFDPDTRTRTRERRDLCWRCKFPVRPGSGRTIVVRIVLPDLEFDVRVHERCEQRIEAQHRKPGWLGPMDTAVPGTGDGA